MTVAVTAESADFSALASLSRCSAHPEDADQDHAERAAEVAAVDGGEEQRHVQPGRVAPGAVRLGCSAAAW